MAEKAQTMTREQKLNNLVVEILDDVDQAVEKLTPSYIRLFPMRTHEILTALRDEIRNKYTESEDTE